jgi:polysaccharide biosynthesis protein PelE
MLNQKLALYAVLLEIGAWNGGRLFEGNSDAVLAWYLLVHAGASALLALAAILLLPSDTARPRLPVLLLMAGCSYAVPVAGFIGVIGGTLYLRFFHSKAPVQAFDSVQLPVFDPHQRPNASFRQAGMRSFLGNSEAPMQARIGAMVALQYVSGRVSSPLLRDVLTDPSEDIRLLAYGMLDNQEKRINHSIDEELKVLSNETPEESPESRDAKRLAATHRLSDLYWELIYQELVQGDLRLYAISESSRYCQQVLDHDPDNAALNLRQGRLLHALGEHDAAEQAYLRARDLGLPATRILPYLAELRFELRDFAGAQRLMAELANWGSLPRLRPIIDYWNPK